MMVLTWCNTTGCQEYGLWVAAGLPGLIEEGGQDQKSGPCRGLVKSSRWRAG